MKIKTKSLPYEKVMALPRPKAVRPMRPNPVLSALIRLLSIPDLMKVHFTYTTHRMEEAGEGPCLILMNHSSFIDLKIASKVLFPKPYTIICTSDGFVGKPLLMRMIGCIPTRKFVSDISLIRDIQYSIKKLNTSVLMYPEASYSFDGRATALPRHLGSLLKKLDVPLVTIITEGAFALDPLYNCLQRRKVKVSAEVRCLLTREEIAEKSVEELDAILDEAFSFDNFRWQQQNGIEIKEPFRADGLSRILYRCADCGTEGCMEGRGTRLICHHCGKEHELTEQGYLRAVEGETRFAHIPDWYDWQREEVRKSLQDGSYRLDTEVDIAMMVDYKAIYRVGSGRLIHDENGFTLTGCDGKLNYKQPALACYSLYADYYWYELGDIICIGDKDCLYYCFPKQNDVVAKTRIAVEELYKLKKRRPARAKAEAK